MKTTLIVLFCLIIAINSIAAPSKPSVSGSSTLTISGSSFGTKTSAAPVRFTTTESDVIGALPSGWGDANVSPTSWRGVSTDKSHGGNKSLLFDFTGLTAAVGERFPRVGFDMGEITQGSYVYLSAWVYFDLQPGTSAGFNWKQPILAATNTYYWSTSFPSHASGWQSFVDITSDYYSSTPAITVPTTANTVVDARGAITQDYWSSETTAVNSPFNGYGWHNANGYKFGEWQRLEWVWKSSSAPSTADASVSMGRFGFSGKTLLSLNNMISNGPSDGLWRYIGLPQGVTNIDMRSVGHAGGTLNLKMYFDDIYVDKSVARVELCNSDVSYIASTHCEIQPATAWESNGTSITATYNPGSFENGQQVYIYVVNSAGEVSPPSDPITISSGQPDATAPVTTATTGIYCTPSLRCSQTPIITLTVNETATTRVCRGSGCDPSAANPASWVYSVPFKVSQNLNGQGFAVQSTDTASNAEAIKRYVVSKKIKR